jgi:peptidoglycan/LPS O-acetylase OafA/YrhL
MLGVEVFFVISGYLITTLLLREEAKTGKIALREFYVRRVFRLLPAVAVYGATILILERLGVLSLSPGDPLALGTFTMNFHAERAWWLGHTWSLSVEQQFYVLWPAALAFLGAAGGLRLALVAIVLSPILRVAVFYGWPSLRPYVDQAFPLVFDALATGCALAILRERLWAARWYRGLLESRWFILVPAVVALAFYKPPRVAFTLLLGLTITHVGLALCIDWSMRNVDSLVGRFLNSRPLVWLGTISYSLYLWQQFFTGEEHAAWYRGVPQNVLLLLLVATVSYYAVEKPGMEARQLWARVRAARVRPAIAPGTDETPS